MATPGNSGIATSIRAISCQLRFARTTSGTKACLRWTSRMMRRRSASVTSINLAIALRVPEIAGLLGDDDDAIIGPVVGERCAKAVEDAPARRGQKPHVNAVLLSHDRVFVAVEDLQLVHAGGKGTA